MKKNFFFLISFYIQFCSIFTYTFPYFSISISGTLYKDDCKTQAANFLLIGGGILLATSALNIFAILISMISKRYDIIAEIFSPLASLAHFVVYDKIIILNQRCL